MIDGTVKKIEWFRYLSPAFKVNKVVGRWTTCGTPILSMITGHNAASVEKHCPRTRYGWSTKALSRHLTNKGYTVIQVTKNSVTNVNYWSLCPINPNHLLVINASVNTKEASWFLLHQNVLWHNDYVEEDFNSLYFFNKPTQDVLMVWHKKWTTPEMRMQIARRDKISREQKN